MNDKPEINDKIKQEFLDSGISEEEFLSLIKHFNDLEQKAINNQANSKDVELLVQKIIDLSIALKDSTLFTKRIRKLSKNYTRLFPLLIHTFKVVKQDQIEYADNNNPREQVQNSITYTNYLKDELILPIMRKIAHDTEISYTSKYFGKIPSVTLNDLVDHHTASLLLELDKHLENIMQPIKEWSGQICALKTYALCMGHLNKENITATALTSKTLSNYLEEFANSNSIEKSRKISPRVIVVSNEIMDLFSITKKLHLHGTTLERKQLIIISVDENTDSWIFLKIIIREFQHLFNELYFTQPEYTNPSPELTEQGWSTFYNFTNTLIFSDKLYHLILEDIQEILKDVERYDSKKRTLDKLSSHMTFLLFYYPPYDVRATIDLILDNFAKTTIKIDNQDEALLVCKVLSKAFYMIEHTLEHISAALYELMKDKITENYEKEVKKYEASLNNWDNQLRDIQLIATSKAQNIQDLSTLDSSQQQARDKKTYEFFKKALKLAKEDLKPTSLDNDYWDERLEAIDIEERGNANIIQGASYSSSCYSLHHQVKENNLDNVKYLLGLLSKQDLDKTDKAGFPALAYAIQNKNKEMFELLLQHGVSLNWKGEVAKIKNITFLHLAAHWGSYDIVTLLVKKGLDITALDEKKQTPLMLLAIHTASIDHNNQPSENWAHDYKQSIVALTYLLSYNKETENKCLNELNLLFFNSLKAFQRNVAIFFFLHQTGNLDRMKILPPDIIRNIAQQFDGYVPNKSYKNCYQDIILELLSNKTLLNIFIENGIYNAASELHELMRMEPSSKNNKFYKLNLLNLFTKNKNTVTPPTSEEKKNQFVTFYSRRNLFMGAESLSAVTLAKREELHSTKKTPKSIEKKYENRRSAIKTWSKKIESNIGEDEGLYDTILQACNQLGIDEIDSHIYNKFSSILHKIVLLEKKTPSTYSPFLNEFKRDYQKVEDNLITTQEGNANMNLNLTP